MQCQNHDMRCHASRVIVQIEKALAGCTAGAVSTILTYPMELLRTRMSMSGAQNLSRTIASVVAGQGIAGFYRVGPAGRVPLAIRGDVEAMLAGVISVALGDLELHVVHRAQQLMHHACSSASHLHMLQAACRF